MGQQSFTSKKSVSEVDLLCDKLYEFQINERGCRSHLKLACQHELQTFSNTKVSAAKDHDKNCTRLRPFLVHHLWRNCLLISLKRGGGGGGGGALECYMTGRCPFLKNLDNLFREKVCILINCSGITDYHHFQKRIGKTTACCF